MAEQGTGILIDKLNARTEARRASDGELARITGQTVEELDADSTELDSTEDAELAQLDRRIGDLPERIALTEHTGMVLHCFCTIENVNGDRGEFTEYVNACGRGGQSLEYWQWRSMLAMFRAARQQMDDARDEEQTMASVRAASYPW